MASAPASEERLKGRRSHTSAGEYARRACEQLAFAAASSLFAAAVIVLANAALLRSRSVLRVRAWRRQAAQMRATVNWKALFRPALRLTEAGLWILAVGTLGYCSYAYASAALHQQHQKAAFAEAQAQARQTPDAASPVAASLPLPLARGEMLGILDIPRIGLSSVVEQGADAHVLRNSVGHIPGTALPGESGNAALAAHRDTYFRHLSELHAGDQILFHTIAGTYRYTVQSTRIVPPTDTAVLASTRKPTLTLVTCFPFYYVGSAPKRFVLVATENNPHP